MAYFSYTADGLVHFGVDRTVPLGATTYESESAWQQAQFAILQDAPPAPSEPVEPEVPAALPTSCTKLGLKRAFVEKGWWETVRAMIAGNAEFAEDWNLAVELQISDPLIKEAVAGLAQLGLPLSDADVQDLVTRANVLVQPAPVAA